MEDVEAVTQFETERTHGMGPPESELPVEDVIEIADSPAGTNYLTDLEKLNDSSEEIDKTSGNLSPVSFAEKLKTLLERKG